ncbi:MAG: UMP kinase [Nanoarchaeota archaeon]|nr:UMP kinase [Nanoarchaeota archaeon]MBU4300599.1 UMP kinase [Nanoarchaeota archaeon]MBU4451745.1 UMP kinase [Nanoarchaeota archaeon]MCG2723714.1 UMP kinase [archaeon]
MNVVISLGGSLLTKDFSVSGVKQYIDVLKKIAQNTEKLVIIVGGGRVCRQYQAIARELGATQDMQDYIGIKATHFNASLVASALTKYAEVPNNEKGLKAALSKNKVVVAGGLKAGQSTDAVAAFAAKEINADLLINASNIDGVYDSNPRENKNAKKLPVLNYVQLKQILSANAQLPGQYGLFDLRAADTISRAKIKTIFIDGTDAEEIWRAAFGKHGGSVVE